MANERPYTREQLADAEEMAQTIANLPPQRQREVTMLVSAFIAGMEAQNQMSADCNLSRASAPA